MRVIIENDISLSNFEAWSGGADTLETLIDKDLVDDLEAIIDDEAVSGAEGWTDTSLNDFLWFERDTIAEWLGFSDWEELENGKEAEEEYTEEEAEAMLYESIGNGETFKNFCLNFSSCDSCPFNDRCKSIAECENEYYRIAEEYEEMQNSALPF